MFCYELHDQLDYHLVFSELIENLFESVAVYEQEVKDGPYGLHQFKAVIESLEATSYGLNCSLAIGLVGNAFCRRNENRGGISFEAGELLLDGRELESEGVADVVLVEKLVEL